MLSWLQKGDYKTWAKESASHQSTGPHGGKVKTFLNASLEASLAAKNAQHPKGAASVKELVDDKDGLKGWAVSVKTQDDSAKGAGWYWYETFSTTSGAGALEGQGKSLCVNCHVGGADYVLVPFPLK
jgi:hypothetical protein